MRIIDNLDTCAKTGILESYIAYAKAEIAEYGLTDDVKEYAVGYGETWFLELSDFANINPSTITSWLGPRPPHRPKVW